MKTAVLSGLVLAVNAGDPIYDGGVPAPAPAAPAPAPYDPAKPDEVVSDPVTPPTGEYDMPEPPKPVEEPVYEDKPPTPPAPVYDDVDDDDVDDEYVEKPVEKPTDVVDEYVPPAKPTPEYPVDMPDDDDDYYGKPEPVDDYPTKPPTPIHDPGSQEACGALYVDVLSQYFHYILSHIDQHIVDAIIKLLQDLLDMVLNLDEADEDTVMKVVEQVKAVADYAGQHLLDDETKEYVLKAMQRAQETYGAIYKTSVDPDVAKAWKDLWEPCHNGASPSTPDETYAPLVDSYYQAYSGYLEQGADSPVYKEEIEKLCEHEDEAVQSAGYEVKDAVMKLQSAEDETEDGVGDATASAGKVVAALSLVSSALAMLF